MRKLLESKNSGELLDFLEEYAKRDDAFRNALRVRFAKPDFHAELKSISAKIDNVLDDVPNYNRHRGGWGYVNIDTDNIIFEIEERVKQGHIKLAFAELEILYVKLINLFEYQEECEISDKAESCLWFMSDVAEKAVETSDCTYIYEHSIDLACLEDGKDYGADYEDTLLSIAARFVTQDNRAMLEDALSQFETGWRAEEFKLIYLTMLQRLEGKSAVNAYIAANLTSPKIREIAFCAAIECQNYAKAEQLCMDAIADYNQREAKPWLYKLYEVYEYTNDNGKKADTAEQLLLMGDLSYYDKLKAILTNDNRWHDAYPMLLEKCAKQLHYSQHMQILRNENEFALLLEQLKIHTEQIYTYGKTLAAHYESDICDVFLARMESEAENASNRDAYHKVCEHIAAFANAGYASAVASLVAEYKLKYKRRPAFVDELGKVNVNL